jgi:HAD superfamily 5'-nucleotidase-like hydrolase
VKVWTPSLLASPLPYDQGDPDRLPAAKKVYALRNLPLRHVKAIGFDMDYTLARYRSPEIDALAFTKALRILVRERDYPASLLELHYDADFAVRGLILDGIRGNLLKLSADRMVLRATHGRRSLTREELEATYGRRRLVTSAKGLRSLDTLFEIPEGALYATLVEALDQHHFPGKTYLDLFKDVRWAIDSAHRNGEMKAEILTHRDFFIPRDPELGPALDRLRRGGKKVFLLTNSEWSFTQGVMSHLLEGQDEGHSKWTDYFDLLVVSSRKPRFYEEGSDPKPLPGLANGFEGGNATWLEEKLGASGEEILYVGDHIYGDVLKSKKTASWRTMLLIPELERELGLLETHGEELREMLRLETRRRRTQRKGELLADQLKRQRLRRHHMAGAVSADALAALDKAIADLARQVEAQGREAAHCADAMAKLNAKVETEFSPHWGPIFRDGYQQTRFADQIQQYACAYTGRISNFYFVDPEGTVYAPIPALPHERVG